MTTKKIENPQNQVIASLDPSELEESLDALTSAGFAREGITTIRPEEVDTIESPLTEPGLSGFLHRLVLGYGTDLENLRYLRAEVEEFDRAVVMVSVEEETEKDQAIDILKSRGAHTLQYVGDWTIEVL